MSIPGQPLAGEARSDQVFFSAALADALGRQEAVWLRVQGVSMLPWLREGEKVCIVPVPDRPLRRGEIALFWRKPNRPILHRVVRVGHEAGALVYECLGDSERGIPEPVHASAVMGVVKSTGLSRAVYLVLNPARRFINRLCLKWGICLRHG
jgi:hypothetical protein